MNSRRPIERPADASISTSIDTVVPRGISDGAWRRWLLMIVVAGLALRLAVAVYADLHPAAFDFPDSHRYLAVARHLADGNGPIESDRIRAGTDPLYPLLLAIGPKIGLDSDRELLRLGRFFNSMASGFAIILLAMLGRALFDAMVGLLAAAVLAFDPILVFFNSLVLTETIYIVVLLSAYAVLLRRDDAIRLSSFVAGGILLGLAALLRSSSLILPLLIAPLAAWRCNAGVTRKLVAVTVLLAAAILPMSPTLVRNYRLFGAFVPVRTGVGASLLEALGPWADGGPGMDKIRYPAFPEEADEWQRDRMCRERAVAWLRENPARAAELALVKLRRTWSLSLNAPDYASPFYRWTARCTVVPIFTLAVAGVCCLRHRLRLLALLLAPAVYFTLLHMVFVGSVRYRIPAMPLLFLLAAVAVRSVWLRIQARPRSPN